MGPQPDASDPAAMRRYTQTYEYDPADNLIKLVHTPVGGTGWTRRYNYTTTGNRLQSTSISGDSPGATYTTPGTYTYSDHYEHDEHGSMTSMPHLPTMTWGHRDELTECTVGSETLHFQYAGGQRVRKHVIKTGSTTEERVYIGRYEKYTRRISGAEDMVRETLHLGDDLGRVAMVETKTVEGGTAVSSPVGMWRHPLGNMLGTAGGETTEDGSVIGYEEYHPYGTTAYRAKASGIDVSERRYRYTGMEQDEETGLGYHTARYYAGWLGRWVSADPIGLGGGGNRFGYADGRPTVLVDPGGMDPPNRTPTMWDSISAAAADPVGTASRFLERVERSLSGVPDTAESPSSPFDEQRRLEASASAAQSLPAVVLGAVAAAGIDIGRRTPDAVASVGDSTARGLRFAASIANSVVVEGGIKGDFSNDDSWAKLIGQTLVSGVPLLGTPADVRDVVANVKKGDLRGAAIAGVGIVLPFANLVNRARRSGKEGIEAGMESLADGVRGLDVGPTSRSAAKGGVEVLPGGARSQVEAARSFAGKLPSEASAKVPSSWGSATATKKGVGVRWSDPANPKGSGIRIDQGDPALPNPSQRVDHVVVRSEGKILGPDGNPIPGPLKDHPEAHIPLDVWKNWKTWNRP
jgi:RHS repeat-associated protein